MSETDVPNWLNSSFFETALRSGGYGSSVTVTSNEIGRATVAGDNYISEIYRAKLQVILEGGRSTVSLIVKAIPAKEELSKVSILFCVVIYVRDICTIFNCETKYIFLLTIHLLPIRIYVVQICRSL
jgi:hypothetical protein